MMFWTLHPKYLDPAGLVALWREALLARAVLRGTTLGQNASGRRIVETTGQVSAEWDHLLNKLRGRRPERFRELVTIRRPEAHPLFRIVPGPVRAWERSAA